MVTRYYPVDFGRVKNTSYFRRRVAAGLEQDPRRPAAVRDYPVGEGGAPECSMGWLPGGGPRYAGPNHRLLDCRCRGSRICRVPAVELQLTSVDSPRGFRGSVPMCAGCARRERERQEEVSL